MKSLEWGLAIGLMTASAITAQTPEAAQPAPAAPAVQRPPTAGEIQRALQIMQQRVDLQTEQLSALKDKMIALDSSIENRIDRLLKQLASIKDSTDSKTRLGNLKEDVIEDLRKSIAFYKNERNRRVAAMMQQTAGLTPEQLQQDVKKLDERSEKRVEQIVELTKTLATHKGYQRYDTYWDDDDVVFVESDKFKHNRREASNTAKAKQDLLDAARKSLEDLKRQNATLEQAIPYKRSDGEKQLLRAQIEHNNKLADDVREQIQSMIASAPVDSGRELGGNEAFQMQQLVNEMVAALKRDMNSLRAMIYERDNARIRLNSLEAQKARIQSMLDKAASPPPPAGT